VGTNNCEQPSQFLSTGSIGRASADRNDQQ
jgi:hypothetical protein